ncbi:TenA family protein, partial [Micromonospora sp. WMMD736]|uniref:TenA family protein n=1 Tax=Micromonospora sp. WMMD736 TaxID=3404112 RepID=UPI003B9582FD
MSDVTSAQTWSEALWSGIEPIYSAILAHPFVTGLTDGTLAPDVFAHYVAQDVHYLRDYARALSVASAKAPTQADTAMFARHAAQVFDVELALHAELLPQLGFDLADIDAAGVTPTTRAYTSYLLATAYGGSFADGLAAVLPCYWIYARVGQELTEKGSPDRRYQLWIDSYGGEEFATTVAEVLAL